MCLFLAPVPGDVLSRQQEERDACRRVPLDAGLRYFQHTQFSVILCLFVNCA